VEYRKRFPKIATVQLAQAIADVDIAHPISSKTIRHLFKTAMGDIDRIDVLYESFRHDLNAETRAMILMEAMAQIDSSAFARLWVLWSNLAIDAQTLSWLSEASLRHGKDRTFIDSLLSREYNISDSGPRAQLDSIGKIHDKDLMTKIFKIYRPADLTPSDKQDVYKHLLNVNGQEPIPQAIMSLLRVDTQPPRSKISGLSEAIASGRVHRKQYVKHASLVDLPPLNKVEVVSMFLPFRDEIEGLLRVLGANNLPPLNKSEVTDMLIEANLLHLLKYLK